MKCSRDTSLMTVDLAEWFGEGEIPSACEVCYSGAPVVGVVGTAEHLGACQRCVDQWKARRVAECITCGAERHPSNMVNVYDGEYQCQECRWGL